MNYNPLLVLEEICSIKFDNVWVLELTKVLDFAWGFFQRRIITFSTIFKVFHFSERVQSRKHITYPPFPRKPSNSWVSVNFPVYWNGEWPFWVLWVSLEHLKQKTFLHFSQIASLISPEWIWHWFKLACMGFGGELLVIWWRAKYNIKLKKFWQ